MCLSSHLNFSVISGLCRERLRRVVCWKRSEIGSPTYIRHKNRSACKYLWLHPHDLWRHRSPTHTFHLTALLSIFSVSSVSSFPVPRDGRCTQSIWSVLYGRLLQILSSKVYYRSPAPAVLWSPSARASLHQTAEIRVVATIKAFINVLARSLTQLILLGCSWKKKKCSWPHIKHWLSHQSDMFIASYLL